MSPIPIKEDQNVEGLRFSSLPPSPLKLLLSFLLVLLLCTGIHAQWSPVDGHIVAAGPQAHYDMVADHDGGVWLAWERGSGVTGDGYTRLQRFDREGFAVFPGDGLQLTADSLGHTTHHLIGMVQTLENDVIVVFNNASIEPDSGWSLYAQRFTPEGDLVFGPVGAAVSVRGFSQMALLFPVQKDQWVFPDGEGGVWVGYTPYDSPDQLYFNGIHADGSRWFEEDVYVGWRDDRGYAICSDLEGGCWVANEDMAAPFSQLEYIRYDPEGNLIHQISYDEETAGPSMQLVSDSLGGIIYGAGGESVLVLQRITNEGERLWHSYPNHPLYFASHSSRFLRTSDNGLIAVAGFGVSQAGFERITIEGEPYFEERSVTIHTSDDLNYDSPDRALIAEDGMGGWYGFYGIYRDSSGEHWTGFRVWRITPEGENTWPPDLELCTPKLPLPEYGMGVFQKAVSCSDCTAVIAVSQWSNGWQLRLYKVLPEGALAGMPNHVDEEDPATPAVMDIEAWPNPFNQCVRISFSVMARTRIELTIYDILGREVHSSNSFLESGFHSHNWTPASTLASGVYFIQIKDQQNRSVIKKAALLR